MSLHVLTGEKRKKNQWPQECDLNVEGDSITTSSYVPQLGFWPDPDLCQQWDKDDKG